MKLSQIYRACPPEVFETLLRVEMLKALYPDLFDIGRAARTVETRAKAVMETVYSQPVPVQNRRGGRRWNRIGRGVTVQVGDNVTHWDDLEIQ